MISQNNYEVLQRLKTVWDHNPFFREVWGSVGGFPRFFEMVMGIEEKLIITKDYNLEPAPRPHKFKHKKAIKRAKPMSDFDKLRCKTYNLAWKKNKDNFEENLAKGNLPTRVILDQYFYRTGEHFVPLEKLEPLGDMSKGFIILHHASIINDVKQNGHVHKDV